MALTWLVVLFLSILKTTGHRFLVDRDLIEKKDGFRINFRDGDGQVKGNGFRSLGCWKDTWDRAIEPLEGKHELLMDINYKLREDPLRKCAIAALDNQLQLFAIENGGQCLGDKTAANFYQRFGKADQCEDDGYGGPWSMQVYGFTGFEVKPQNGGYTKWSLWTMCTKTCGKGIKTRTRSCTQPTPAYGGVGCERLGPAVQTKPCSDACSVKETGGSSSKRKDDMENDKDDDEDDDYDTDDVPTNNDSTSVRDNTPKRDDNMPKTSADIPSVDTKSFNNIPTLLGREQVANYRTEAPQNTNNGRNIVEENGWERELKQAHDILRARWRAIANNRLKVSPIHMVHGSSRQEVVDASLKDDDEAQENEQEQEEQEDEEPRNDNDNEDDEMDEEKDPEEGNPQDMSDEVDQSGTKRITEECICPAIMCLHLADTGVLIDNSNVTDIADLAEMKAFAKGLAAGFGTKEKDIQMGIIAAGMRSHVVVPFHETLPYHDFMRRVSGINRERGPSALGQAFKRAEAYLLAKQKKAIPPLLNDVLFVMVSSDSDVEVHAPVKDLKSAGAKIVAIGVGKNAKLGKLAGQADKAFMVPPGAGNALVNAIIAAVCKPDLMGKMLPNAKPCPCMLGPSKKRTSPDNSMTGNSPNLALSTLNNPDSTTDESQALTYTGTETPANDKPTLEAQQLSKDQGVIGEVHKSGTTTPNATPNTSVKNPPATLPATAPKITSPLKIVYANKPSISPESSPATSAGTLPATLPKIGAASSQNVDTLRTNAVSHSDGKIVEEHNATRSMNDKIRPLSKSLYVLSKNLNKAREAGELKEGNFTLNKDIKDLLNNIEILKNQADSLRSGKEKNERKNGQTQDITQTVSGPGLSGQSASKTSSSKQSKASSGQSGEIPLKLRIRDQTILKQGAHEPVQNAKMNNQLGPTIKITDQPLEDWKPASQSGKGNPSSTSNISHDVKPRPITVQNAKPAQPISSMNAKPAQPISAQNAKLAQPISAQNAKLAQPISNQNTKLAQPISTQNAKLAQPISTQNAKLAQPISTQNAKLAQQNSNSGNTEFALAPPIQARKVDLAQSTTHPEAKLANTKSKPSIPSSQPVNPLQSSLTSATKPGLQNRVHNSLVTHWPPGTREEKEMPAATSQGIQKVKSGKQNFETIENDLANNPTQTAFPKSSMPACDMNLGFVLDGSASVEGTKRGNFLKMINFVKDMIHEFAELSHAVHVGTLVYSTNTSVILTFGTKGTEQMIDRILDSVHYPGQGSLTGNAITEAWNRMFSVAPRGRKSAMLLLTDGPSNDDIRKPSKWIKDEGVELFVIGLGNGYDETQLNIMASGPPDRHVMTKKYDDLRTSVQEVRNKLCGYSADQILQMMANPFYKRYQETMDQRRLKPYQCIIDVAFLLDGSRQIETNGEGNFKRAISFVKKAAKYLPLSRNDVHMGVGLLGDREVMVFPMNEHYTEKAVDFELDHVQFPAAEDIRADELKAARDIMLNVGARDVAPHVFVLVTDVSSLGSYRSAIADMRRKGYEVIMFGIGSFSWKQEIKVRSSVEGLDDQVITLENSDEDEAAKQFSANLCKLANAKRSDIPRQHWKQSHKLINNDK